MKNKAFRLPGIVLLLLVALSFSALSSCKKEEENLPGYKVRKNVKDLSDEEKSTLVDAILALKAMPSPFTDTLTYYDQMVAFHQMAVAESNVQGYGVAHRNPAFPPWHRKLLLLYEEALSYAAGEEIALPYWDWTDPASTAAVFTEDFMGPGGVKEEGYAVLSGPFRKGVWQLNLLPMDSAQRLQSPHQYLVRGMGDASGNSYPVALPTAWEVEQNLAVDTYDSQPYDATTPRAMSFRCFLEGFDTERPNSQFMHNIVHDWVAGIFIFEGDTMIGSMEPLDVSPNDPVFFLHHANVDRIWAIWEESHPDSYVPTSGWTYGANLNDEMYPFRLWKGDPLMTGTSGITPGSMLNTEELGYVYE